MVSKLGSIPGEVAREVVDRRMDVVGEEEGDHVGVAGCHCMMKQTGATRHHVDTCSGLLQT